MDEGERQPMHRSLLAVTIQAWLTQPMQMAAYAQRQIVWNCPFGEP